VLLDFSAD